MNDQELYDEWTSGEQNGMRPKRVQALRGDLSDALGMYVPHRVGEIEGWLDRMRQSGTITKKLRDAAEGSDEDPNEETEESTDE